MKDIKVSIDMIPCVLQLIRISIYLTACITKFISLFTGFDELVNDYCAKETSIYSCKENYFHQWNPQAETCRERY